MLAGGHMEGFLQSWKQRRHAFVEALERTYLGGYNECIKRAIRTQGVFLYPVLIKSERLRFHDRSGQENSVFLPGSCVPVTSHKYLRVIYYIYQMIWSLRVLLV